MSAHAATLPTDTEVLEQVRHELQNLGYPEDCLARDYRFVDFLDEAIPTCELALLAFAPGPRDYRSACVAFGFELGRTTARAVRQARSAGAARSLVVSPREVQVFDTTGPSPTLIARPARADIGAYLRRDPDLWRPESVLRAKGIAGPVTWQATLGEHLGLIPLLDREVGVRLTGLLKEIFANLEGAGGRAAHPRTHFPDVVRLVFWLVTAATLIDRQHPSAARFGATAADALALAAYHNGVIRDPGEALGDYTPLAGRPDLWARAWERIRAAPYFRLLPPNVLAHLYEEVLVTPEVRRRLSIHATPRWLAEMAAGLVPWEHLPSDRQRVVELCAGHGPFLLASLGPLRDLQPVGLSAEAAHAWLVDRLRAVEIEPFSREVCRLSLTAAVYPDGDGWDLQCADIHQKGVVGLAVEEAGVVFCNPPFERAEGAQTTEEARGPEGLVRRLLESGRPACLALVLPRRMVESRGSLLYRLLAELYARIDVVRLSDGVFAHSSVETALLVASQPGPHARVALRTASVPRLPRSRSRPTLDQLRWESTSRTVDEVGASGLLVPPLQSLWDQLRHHPRLQAVATVKRGIEYLDSIKKSEDRAHVFSAGPREGWSRGVAQVAELRALRAPATCYMETDPAKLRRGSRHAWASPKVLVNAARVSRGAWRGVASVDREGLWAYQRLQGVWPHDPMAWPIEVVAAVLMGPVAAAHLYAATGRRDLRMGDWESVPLPMLRALDRERIVRLVTDLGNLGDAEIPAKRMMEIDALVLEGYRLPARVERDLLRFFDGHERKGVGGFRGYPGRETASAFHLHELLDEVHQRATAARILETLPTFNDADLSERLARVG